MKVVHGFFMGGPMWALWGNMLWGGGLQKKCLFWSTSKEMVRLQPNMIGIIIRGRISVVVGIPNVYEYWGGWI